MVYVFFISIGNRNMEIIYLMGIRSIRRVVVL